MLLNREIIRVGSRQIPEKEIPERAFVAIPLGEIAPNLSHPITGQKISEIAAAFESTSPGMITRNDVKLL